MKRALLLLTLLLFSCVQCLAVDHLEGAKDLTPVSSKEHEGCIEKFYEKDGVKFSVSDQYGTLPNYAWVAFAGDNRPGIAIDWDEVGELTEVNASGLKNANALTDVKNKCVLTWVHLEEGKPPVGIGFLVRDHKMKVVSLAK